MKRPRRFVSAIFVLVAAILLTGETLTCLAQQSSTPAASSMAPTPAPPRTERTPFAECLPSGITLNTLVEVKWTLIDHRNTILKVRVNQKLTKLKAYCTANHVLVDGGGRPIAFFRWQCLGDAAPPPQVLREEEKVVEEELERLRALKQKYDVVQIDC